MTGNAHLSRGVRVNRMRLSLIWVQAWPRGEGLPDLMSNRLQYIDGFKAARNALSASWSLPWTHKERRYFWQYYLQRVIRTPEWHDVSAEDAWDYLLPLRARSLVKVQHSPNMDVNFEGFCFPHSLGVIANLTLTPETPQFLSQIVGAAIQARHADHYYKLLRDGSESHNSFDNIADVVFDELEQLAFKGKPPGRKPLRQPLSIATIFD